MGRTSKIRSRAGESVKRERTESAQKKAGSRPQKTMEKISILCYTSNCNRVNTVDGMVAF